MDGNINVSIKEMLDYLEAGPSKDEYFYEKRTATMRRLGGHINRIECDELRRILQRKFLNIDKNRSASKTPT